MVFVTVPRFLALTLLHFALEPSGFSQARPQAKAQQDPKETFRAYSQRVTSAMVP